MWLFSPTYDHELKKIKQIVNIKLNQCPRSIRPPSNMIFKKQHTHKNKTKPEAMCLFYLFGNIKVWEFSGFQTQLRVQCAAFLSQLWGTDKQLKYYFLNKKQWSSPWKKNSNTVSETAELQIIITFLYQRTFPGNSLLNQQHLC